MGDILPRALILTVLFVFSHTISADKTDIVWLKNGDRITGEVKNLDKGKLKFKTDHMGTVFIEWEDIEEIVSNKGQSVELTDGQRIFGPLGKPEEADLITVQTDQGPVGVGIEDVITMYPVEAGFWDRGDLRIKLGFSWDKASNVGRYNIGMDGEYRDPKFITRTSFTTEVTTQEERDDTSRSFFDLTHLVFRPDRRFHQYIGSLESNDELGIDLRTVVGVGYGMVPIRSQRKWFKVGAGLVVNHEVPSVGKTETNLEAVGMAAYDYYRYSSPKRRLRLELTAYPSLTDFGRWRATFDTTFSLELVSDLFWDMDFFATYDSDPLSVTGSNTDYGIISGLAYSF